VASRQQRSRCRCAATLSCLNVPLNRARIELSVEHQVNTSPNGNEGWANIRSSQVQRKHASKDCAAALLDLESQGCRAYVPLTWRTQSRWSGCRQCPRSLASGSMRAIRPPPRTRDGIQDVKRATGADKVARGGLLVNELGSSPSASEIFLPGPAGNKARRAGGQKPSARAWFSRCGGSRTAPADGDDRQIPHRAGATCQSTGFSHGMCPVR